MKYKGDLKFWFLCISKTNIHLKLSSKCYMHRGLFTANYDNERMCAVQGKL